MIVTITATLLALLALTLSVLVIMRARFIRRQAAEARTFKEAFYLLLTRVAISIDLSPEENPIEIEHLIRTLRQRLALAAAAQVDLEDLEDRIDRALTALTEFHQPAYVGTPTLERADHIRWILEGESDGADE